MGTTQPIRNKDELAAFRMYYKDIHPNRRNYCLIVMGLNTALRISDLLKLKWDNVYNFEHHVFRSHFLINEQKTGKNNYVTGHISMNGIRLNMSLFLQRPLAGGSQ